MGKVQLQSCLSNLTLLQDIYYLQYLYLIFFFCFLNNIYIISTIFTVENMIGKKKKIFQQFGRTKRN